MGKLWENRLAIVFALLSIVALVWVGVLLDSAQYDHGVENETRSTDTETADPSIRKMVIPGDGVVCYILDGGDNSGISCVPLNETGLGTPTPDPEEPADRPPQYAVENGGVASE